MIDVDAGRLVENASRSSSRATGSSPLDDTADVQVPPNASIVDLPSMILLPGLIDAHVHLTLGGNPTANARATLEAGFTTVQDLGACGGPKRAPPGCDQGRSR